MTMSEELTVPEAAEYLHVNPETVRRNIWQKRLPAIQRGRQWFISKADLVNFAATYDPKTGRRTGLSGSQVD